MISSVRERNGLVLPLIVGEFPMIPFNVVTLKGLKGQFKSIAEEMLKGIGVIHGTAYLTVHGKRLKAGETLRRGGAHTDGNYDPVTMDFGGGGWKTGQEGREVTDPIHIEQFNSVKGGMLIASNYASCNGWVGEYAGEPKKGGDCTHLDLGDSFRLKSNTVYYGNNHFIHESLAVTDDTHRVLARITMPVNHQYGE